ncbi:MAG: ATP-binding domain-containing protein, partial [Zoogloeaceae bacterium]|nr:ATP-binding domain-containing protein [Zoogloeaceae bacterium]
SDLDEARFAVDEASQLVQEGMERGKIAFLYRANAQSRVLEHELFTHGIPYRVYGGLRFFERLEIKHALAYLRLIANPDDDTAFLRVVNFPARGIGARTLEHLQAVAHQSNCSLYNAAASLTGKAGATVGHFVRLVEGLRREVEGLPLAEMVAHTLVASGLQAHYRNEKEGQERLENLDELVNAATLFASGVFASGEGGEESDLAAFLSHAALESGEHQADERESAVQLMTVHSAKGLEFDAVFITGLEEGLFPHDNALSSGDLEEERRLMYVAMTRARQRLYLTLAETRLLHGQTRYCLPSRFLDEIPAPLLKQLSVPWSGGERLPARSWSQGKPSGEKPYRAPPEALPGGFRIGMNVRHAKFGFGVIVDAEAGMGTDARVHVNFGGAGMKWLSLAHAKLAAA